MRKVRVLKDFPFVKSGHIFEIQENGTINLWVDDGHNQLLNKPCVIKLISDGWLEEVTEEESLLKKLEKKFSYDDAKWAAQIAMQHAVEVAEKAVKEYDARHAEHGCKGLRHFIIEALKKEAEG